MEMIAFIVAHILADQFLQSIHMRRWKSENVYVFASHLFVHATLMMIVAMVLFIEVPVVGVAMFFADLVWHFIVDFNTSKWYKYSVVWRNRDKTVEELKSSWNWAYDSLFWKYMAVENILHILGIATIFHYLTYFL